MPGGAFARIPIGDGRSVVLYEGDALAELPRRVRRADVVVTSPPYNRGIAYRSYDDRRPRAEYLAWMRAVGRAVGDVLAPAGSFFLNVGGAPSDPWLPWDVAREVATSLELQNVIHWVKSIAIDRRAAGKAAGLARDLAVGHYKPLLSDRYVHGAHEYVFHFSRSGTVPLDRLAIGVPYQDASNEARWRRPRATVRCRGNTWFLPYATIRRRATDRPHPASFPTELPEWCVRLHGVARCRAIVDPFVGIGATALAAVRLGIDCTGFDIDAEYLATAARRVRAAVAGGELPTATRARRRNLRPAGSRSASASS